MWFYYFKQFNLTIFINIIIIFNIYYLGLIYLYTLQFNLIPLVAKTTFHIFIHLNFFYFLFHF